MARYRLLRTDENGVVAGAPVFNGEDNVLLKTGDGVVRLTDHVIGQAMLGAGMGGTDLEERVGALEQALEGIPVPG